MATNSMGSQAQTQRREKGYVSSSILLFQLGAKLFPRELPLLDDATVAIVRKHQSGDEDRTERERSATLVVYVSR